MTFDPYATLGIDKTADSKTVRGAFRRKAKQSHPDAGGQPGEFEKVQKAHLLLTDDRRRAKFDATGEVEDDVPDNTMQGAISVIMSFLDHFLTEAVGKGHSIDGMNVIDICRFNIAKKVENYEGAIGLMNTHIGMVQKIIKKTKRKKPGSDVLLKALEWQVVELKRKLAAPAAEKKAHQDALALLQDYEFDAGLFTQQPMNFRPGMIFFQQ